MYTHDATKQDIQWRDTDLHTPKYYGEKIGLAIEMNRYFKTTLLCYIKSQEELKINIYHPLLIDRHNCPSHNTTQLLSDRRTRPSHLLLMRFRNVTLRIQRWIIIRRTWRFWTTRLTAISIQIIRDLQKRCEIHLVCETVRDKQEAHVQLNSTNVCQTGFGLLSNHSTTQTLHLITENLWTMPGVGQVHKLTQYNTLCGCYHFR